ncbi:ABC transporter permease [Halogeometricum luteum]|uniref:ABC transporter permease n=1 Tax=Halogeometricum luteum TaxID=2950537 RepID=UPI003CCDD9DF
MSTRSTTERVGEWFTGSFPSPTRGVRKLLSLVGFLGVWWLFYQFGVLNFEHFVSPGTALVAFGEVLVGQPLVEGGDTIYLHAAYSTARVAVGVGVAALLAVPLGLVVGTSQRWENLLYTALEALRPIPPIAWLPVAIIVFPALTLGAVSIPLSALFVVFIGAFFPIFTNTVEGARNVEAEFRRAAESLGASSRNVFRHVVLPATLPSIITGLSLGVGLGWITVVAAELVTGGPGLGYIIIRGSRLRNKQTIVIGMLAVGALGYASSALVARLGRWLTPWTDAE